MAYQIKTYAFTIAAGTAKATPLSMDTPLGQFVVSGVELVFPPGCNGNVGLRLTSGGTQMVPANAGGWIVASGETIPWSLSGQITSGKWEAQGYNTGIYDHTIQLRFQLDLITGSAPLPPANLLPVSAIVGTVDGVTAGAGPGAP